MSQIPPLKHGENSWIVVSKETGKPIFETWLPQLVEVLNLELCEVYTSGDWLVELNRQIQSGEIAK